MKTNAGGKAEVSRRTFVVGSAVASGGLALGFNFSDAAKSARAQNLGGEAEINAWVVVKPDDTCVIRIARSEMGQGTRTGLAQLVAEELECDWKNVTTELITPGQNLARKRVWGEMGTGGSRGIRTSQDYVRRGGAAARMMLLQAAANEWNVPVGELTVVDGMIAHASSRRTISSWPRARTTLCHGRVRFGPRTSWARRYDSFSRRAAMSPVSSIHPPRTSVAIG